jgi:hypothetical protein
MLHFNPSGIVLIEYASEFIPQCTYTFRMILSLNRKFFLKLHQPVSFIIEIKHVSLTLGTECLKILWKKSEIQRFNNF